MRPPRNGGRRRALRSVGHSSAAALLLQKSSRARPSGSVSGSRDAEDRSGSTPRAASRTMRVVRVALLYPPPWKLSEPGQPSFPGPDGPPPEYREGDLDPDFHQVPYGLLSLGAEAVRAGHDVKVLNLSAYPWRQVEACVERLEADVYGMSCWTANRRGVRLVSDCIRRLHPEAHVVVGGPHATPLAREVLEHFASVDTVAVGESELTFLELLSRLEAGHGTRGIAGTWYRQGSEILEGPPRASVTDLDTLASPHDHFDTHIVMTSRGCPWQCTFCGAETTWGRGFRGRSVPRVLDDLERALTRLPVKMLQIKDDTFTANRRRALAICQGIVERGLRFSWSCDTRVDVLSDELLVAMRRAGCERLSLGVESGSSRVLEQIDKKITVEQIEKSTELARSVGIQVRYYMMLGNRGETLDTFRETLDFLERARPHEYLFSCLSIYPGTLDFKAAERSGAVRRNDYFERNFQELKMPFDADAACTRAMSEFFEEHRGLQRGYVQSSADARAVLTKLGEHAGAELDLASACYREGDFDAARHHGERALELGHPNPGLAYNLLACLAFRRGDLETMKQHFMTAARTDPQHAPLLRNVEAARRWFRQRGPERGLSLELHASHDFQLFERNVQPTLPGPLPADFDDWTRVPRPSRSQAAAPPPAPSLARRLPLA